MKEYIGIDIGGTKCAVVRGDQAGDLLEKAVFPTADRDKTLELIAAHTEDLWTEQVAAIGVSCGGPLDSRRGVILGPPNLPGWDCVPITELLTKHFAVPVFLKNDADACALAEWRFGAGRGTENMIFLTFGTGLGAGLILGGRLYEGACGMAGEVGHVRLFEGGHVGYGKAGSYEGYCSGGGIAQYGLGSGLELAGRAEMGDRRALEVWRETGSCLGRLLAMLIDILNPEVIVIGSIFARAGIFMKETMNQMLAVEALKPSRERCRVVPSELGEALGDKAALIAAMQFERYS